MGLDIPEAYEGAWTPRGYSQNDQRFFREKRQPTKTGSKRRKRVPRLWLENTGDSGTESVQE